jgi:hypothetical protein
MIVKSDHSTQLPLSTRSSKARLITKYKAEYALIYYKREKINIYLRGRTFCAVM